jgi:DNA-binding response OmpR family regulator
VSLILVVEDDPDIAGLVALTLNLDGFEVRVVADGTEALAEIAVTRPDLVVTDVMMPRLDGFELTRRLRADPATNALPVIILTARDTSADKVTGLTAGADDYVVKPFDPLELIARVRSTLRRNAEMRSISPLTGLPGNERILGEIAHRLASGRPFAVCYLDLDNFKAFNDRYGFLRGDAVITLLASAAQTAAHESCDGPFVGHVGGDDFVVVCDEDSYRPLCERVIELFDAKAPGLYDAADADGGGLEMPDRQGVLRRYPIVSVSIGVALSTRHPFTDHREVVAVATEMKSVAKATPGSAIAVDRRGDS